MMDEKLLKRITADPAIFGGKPIVRGMRVSVELILSLLAQGEEPEDIVADYPDLELDDIRACLAYAHAVIAKEFNLSMKAETYTARPEAAFSQRPSRRARAGTEPLN
jgi:uncharacterized protein (DUF433 family)